jgi:hypothetical protein
MNDRMSLDRDNTWSIITQRVCYVPKEGECIDNSKVYGWNVVSDMMREGYSKAATSQCPYLG